MIEASGVTSLSAAWGGPRHCRPLSYPFPLPAALHAASLGPAKWCGGALPTLFVRLKWQFGHSGAIRLSLYLRQQIEQILNC
jgi:hypothetical protein